jgi:hypothetical protein
MNNKDKKNSLSSEVEDRLDEIFLEDDETEFDASSDMSEASKNPLTELKAVVLSIDWEINDEIMTKFMEEIRGLLSEYSHDHTLTMFLRLLGSIGKYIQGNKANSHPDSIKMLGSVYNSFEKAALSKDMSDGERKKLLEVEANQLKALKNKILKAQGGPSAPEKSNQTAAKASAQRAGDAPYSSRLSADQEDRLASTTDKPVEQAMPPALQAFLIEIKKTIRVEIQTLKEELKVWMKEQ